MPPSNDTGAFTNGAFEADECGNAGRKANLIPYHLTQDHSLNNFINKSFTSPSSPFLLLPATTIRKNFTIYFHFETMGFENLGFY